MGAFFIREEKREKLCNLRGDYVNNFHEAACAVKADFATSDEFHYAVAQRKKCIVSGALHASSGKKLSAALANKNISGADALTIILLDA